MFKVIPSQQQYFDNWQDAFYRVLDVSVCCVTIRRCVSACLHPPQVPFCIVFTKCDARKKGGPTPAANIKAWQQEWLQQYEEVPACFETSAELGQGRSEVLNYLASLRVLEQEQGGEL